MSDTKAVDILNELLREEQRSLGLRVVESTVFVGADDVDKLLVLRSMAEAVKENVHQLTEQIIAMGGVPWPRDYDVSSADLHFQDLHSVFPRMRDDVKRMIRVYEVGVASLRNSPPTLSLLSRILERHRKNLDAIGG